MKNRYGWLWISGLLLIFAGCAGVKPPPASTTGTIAAPEVAPQAPAPAEPTPQAAAESSIGELGPRPPASDNRAVIVLLDRAYTDSAAGKGESAEASLERALRIEPRNPWLWHELARLRLAQGQYPQAITLARKSNSFAGGKHRVQAENWQVIGQARVAQGDSSAAEEAFRQAAALAKQAKGE